MFEFVIVFQECVRGSSDVCEKLEKLEQEYRRLTRTQNNAEAKIRELEYKLQEEEHHRKLIQDKAAQVLHPHCSVHPSLHLFEHA